MRDGAAEPIPPSEYIAWRALTGHIVYGEEYAILTAMDDAYCDELNKEIAAYHERKAEQSSKK